MQGVSQDLKSGGLFQRFRKASFCVPQASNFVYRTWAFWGLVHSTYKIEMGMENFILKVWMHIDNVTLQNACLHDHCGLFATVLTLNLQQLVVFCHKMGVQICPKLEVGGPKDLKTYAWLTHCAEWLVNTFGGEWKADPPLITMTVSIISVGTLLLWSLLSHLICLMAGLSLVGVGCICEIFILMKLAVWH